MISPKQLKAESPSSGDQLPSFLHCKTSHVWPSKCFYRNSFERTQQINELRGLIWTYMTGLHTQRGRFTAKMRIVPPFGGASKQQDNERTIMFRQPMVRLKSLTAVCRLPKGKNDWVHAPDRSWSHFCQASQWQKRGYHTRISYHN